MLQWRLSEACLVEIEKVMTLSVTQKLNTTRQAAPPLADPTKHTHFSPVTYTHTEVD